MTVMRVQVGHDGSMTETQMLDNTGGIVTSNDYVAQGVTVRDANGIGTKTVTAADQLRGDEVIEIQGMSMKVSQARELGLLQRTFDERLSVGAAAAAAEKHQAPKPEGTGHAEYDATSAALTAKIEAGSMDHTEAQAYDTSAAELAMSGLSVEQITETLDGLDDGSLNELDVDSNTRQLARGVEANVTAAATKSAMAELGPDGFKHLSQLAATSPEVNRALRAYAIQRALGQTDATWSDFRQDAIDHLNGVR